MTNPVAEVLVRADDGHLAGVLRPAQTGEGTKSRPATEETPRCCVLAARRIAPSEGQGFSGVTLAYNARSRDEVDSVLAEAEAEGARIL